MGSLRSSHQFCKKQKRYRCCSRRVGHIEEHSLPGWVHISRGRAELCQLGGFSGLGAIVPSFVPAECSGAGGYVGYIRKALEKGHLEHPESACCTDDMFKSFVRFGRCLCCFLPVFVNRQPPYLLHKNLRHVLLLRQMHHRNHWWTFPGFCELLVQCAKISSRWGGGGVCVYFLKSVRKGCFRNVWVGGGGGDDHFFEQAELQSGRCTRQGNA